MSVKYWLSNLLRKGSKSMWPLIDRFIDYGYDASRQPNLSLKIVREYNKSRPYGPRRIICNAPYKQLYFKPNGQVTACCVNGLDVVGQVSEEPVGAIWNGDRLKRFRERIENYDLGGGCSGCRHQLEAGNFHAFTGRLFDDWRPLKHYPYPTDITFEISNTCNLECVMCSGEYSALIRKHREGLPDRPDVYKDDFFKEIRHFLPHLRTARFIGGEPFLIRSYYPLMEYLVEHHPACKIYIQTNGTILNEAVKKIIRSKQVELSISLDSLQPATYELIRKNASFERVSQHLSYFAERSRQYGQAININFCLMTLNWRELPDMVEYCDRNSFSLNVIPVTSPGVYALRTQGTAVLADIVKLFEHTDLKTRNPHLQEVFRETLAYVRFLLLHAPARELKFDSYAMNPAGTLLEQLTSGTEFLSDMPAAERDAVVQEIRKAIADMPEEEQRRMLAYIILELEFSATQSMGSGLELSERLAKTRVMVLELIACRNK